MAKANETTNSNVNSNLSPAQAASGAHNSTTPSPYALIQKVFNEGYLDDHRGWFGAVDHNTYLPNVVLVRTDLRNGAVEVCFATDDSSFCVNPFYVSGEDGKVHLSTWSIGCTVRRNGTKTLEEAIEDANKEALSSPYSFIREILTVVRKDTFMKGFRA